MGILFGLQSLQRLSLSLWEAEKGLKPAKNQMGGTVQVRERQGRGIACACAGGVGGVRALPSGCWHGMTVTSSQAVKNARKLQWPLKETSAGIYESEAPGGYKFFLEDKERPQEAELTPPKSQPTRHSPFAPLLFPMGGAIHRPPVALLPGRPLFLSYSLRLAAAGNCQTALAPSLRLTQNPRQSLSPDSRTGPCSSPTSSLSESTASSSAGCWQATTVRSRTEQRGCNYSVCPSDDALKPKFREDDRTVMHAFAWCSLEDGSAAGRVVHNRSQIPKGLSVC
ncbi:Glyoxalase domain-containing protein 4, partial [Ophiophagus hannah]